MKKLALVIALVAILSMLASCGGTCDRCGDTIEGEAVEAAGREYCSYNCYMKDALFG